MLPSSKQASKHQVSTLTFYLTCPSLHSNDRSLGSASLAMNHSYAITRMERNVCFLFLFSLVSLLFRGRRRRPVRCYWEDFVYSQPENLTGGGGNTTGPSSPHNIRSCGLALFVHGHAAAISTTRDGFLVARAHEYLSIYIYREYSLFITNHCQQQTTSIRQFD